MESEVSMVALQNRERDRRPPSGGPGLRASTPGPNWVPLPSLEVRGGPLQSQVGSPAKWPPFPRSFASLA